jgi:flagellar biosynthesis protein
MPGNNGFGDALEPGANPDRPRPSAIALSYVNNTMAPVVVAKGYGAVAESIVQRGRDSGLYVHESPELVKLLMHVNLDAEIPPQLYVALAEVLAWVYRLESSRCEPPGQFT